MMRRSLNILLLALLSASLIACGFNTRGSGRQTGSEVVGQLFVEGNASILRSLRNALTAQQVQFSAFREEADTIIKIDNEVLSRRIASVSASGRVSEFELLHSIDLLTLRSKVIGEDVSTDRTDIQPQTVSVIRDYTYDETDVLAKDDEERILRKEMSDELVRHLVLRIFAGSR